MFFKNLIDRYLSKDHALASITAALILISTFITEALPQFTFLSPEVAAVIVLIGSLCATIAGYFKATPALTWAGILTLSYQIVTLLIATDIGKGTRVEIALLTLAALLKFASKFIPINSTSPLATGASTDIGRERTQAKP